MLAVVIGATLAWGDTGYLPPPTLQFSLALEKDTFEVGEPIVALVRLTNHGTGDYIVQTSTRPAGSFDGFAFAVEDERGQAVPPPHPRLPATHWLGSWTTIRPREQTERKFFLNHWFLPLHPGRYTVRAQYIPRTTSGHHTVEWPPVHAAPVTFTIVPVGQTKLAVRIERLTAQLEAGDPLAADFLGFTGETAAIAPLLRALHQHDETVPRHAANALNNILDRPAVIAAALDALRENGPNPVFVEWLHERRLPPAQLMPAYLDHLASPDVVTRRGALIGLRLERDAEHAAVIRAHALRALADPDASVRLEAVRLFAADPETRAALQRVAEQDSHESVRALAATLVRESHPAGPPAELRP